MEVHALHLDHIFIDLKVLMINLLDKIKNLMRKKIYRELSKLTPCFCLFASRLPGNRKELWVITVTQCFDSNTDNGERVLELIPN